ncbi:MAG: UDP-N-acetylmuramoyl-L-alanine--D-glutamate ligase [Anaerolineae bacterium]|nr:UDP-N-acetylmuramoyl-L-alanine--D-glutamate ligase [Anaerolineae bacterium]
MAVSPAHLRYIRAGIVGAAREGTALARYLLHCGAEVTLSDSKSADALGDRVAELAGLDLHLVLGSNPPELLDVDVLFLSPGVPPYAPIVQQARAKGVPISSEPRFFTQIFPGLVVGITGSAGKTTTAALTAQMYAAGGRDTWLGGNIGMPLLARLIDEPPPEVAVMELSSFQLELFAPEYQGDAVERRRSIASRAISLGGWSPSIAAITNITPNHLDRHPSMEDYIRAKANILRFQSEGDWAILSADDAATRALAAQTRARPLFFSLEETVAEGVFLQGERLLLRQDGRERLLVDTGKIRLRGRHNWANVAAAACCAVAGGVDPSAVQEVAVSFTGVAHRLEPVRDWRGVLFVNDSIATAPERAMAALSSFSEPLVLLAGGRDKHLPWDDWADLVIQRVRVVIAFGEASPIIVGALDQARERHRLAPSSGPKLSVVESLEQAVVEAASVAQTGDVVLLSPGGTSFDAFVDFEARGARFRELVGLL